MDFENKVKKLLVGVGVKLEGVELEIPPDSKMGDYAFPCFELARVKKKNPVEIAKDIAKKIKPDSFVEKIEAAGGYVNFFVKRGVFIEGVLSEVLEKEEEYGSSCVGGGKIVCFDYSHPNVAKPFGIGHLRSTIIGNSLYRIHNFLGYKSVGLNYLGDWGTQFGKLIVAYNKWGEKKKLEKGMIKYMHELYVKFHKESEKDDNLNVEARAAFSRLEGGGKEEMRLWKMFRDESVTDFKRLYGVLGVGEFDSYDGESSVTPLIAGVMKELNRKKLLEESEGALVVNLEKYELPPCLIKKSDGATLYSTRDIAGAINRQKVYKFEKMVYNVGEEQKLYFEQLFRVLSLMGHKWVDRCVHAYHGMYLGEDGKRFRTRKGGVIFMEDVIKDGVEKVLKIIEEKNPKLKDKEEVARKVGVGAIKFADLKNDRVKGIVFDLDKMLDFEGDTGPYLQYTYVRCNSILRKAKSGGYDVGLLKDDREFLLIKKLSGFGDVVVRCAKELKPHYLAGYLIEVARLFNEFYRECPVLKAKKGLRESRLALVKAVKCVLGNGLGLLGIDVLEEM